MGDTDMTSLSPDEVKKEAHTINAGLLVSSKKGFIFEHKVRLLDQNTGFPPKVGIDEGEWREVVQ